MYCQYTKQLFHFTQWFKAKTETPVNVNINFYFILLGSPNESFLLNYIFVIIKSHICSCKYTKQKPDWKDIVNKIFFIEIFEYRFLDNEDHFTKKL